MNFTEISANDKFKPTPLLSLLTAVGIIIFLAVIYQEASNAYIADGSSLKDLISMRK